MPLTISRIDLPREPYWLDLPLGVRIKVRPLDAALFAAATRMAADTLSETQPGFAQAIAVGESARAVSDGVWAATLTTAVAQLAILDWTGVLDGETDPCLPDPQAIRLVFDRNWMLALEFHRLYVLQAEGLIAEGEGSAPAPNGSSAGAPTTAEPAEIPEYDPPDLSRGLGRRSRPARTARP
ncbi:MAG: hypothetical protein GVY13_19705 [Alphaproteobacteria bacterium]|jgi:hypothetical protein|nr:hypothetical protein [Alphaproteobacteria bacterium]